MITQIGPGVALDIFDVKGGFGFAWNSLVNEAAKWTGQKAVVWPLLAKATEKKREAQ